MRRRLTTFCIGSPDDQKIPTKRSPLARIMILEPYNDGIHHHGHVAKLFTPSSILDKSYEVTKASSFD
jgi:hypothetical protein